MKIWKKKTAYCSLTYLFSFEPEEFGLNSSSPVEDIYNAAAKKIEEYVSAIRCGIGFSVDDIEIMVDGE